LIDPVSRLSVHSRPGMLSVTDPRLFAPGQEARAASFARRLFRIPEVRSIEVDSSTATAAVRYRGSPGDQQILIGRLADALTSDGCSESQTMPSWRRGETVKLRRYGDIITTLEILTVTKNCLEARYRANGSDSMRARRVTDALRQIPGLLEVTIEAGKLTIRLDPVIPSVEELVRRVEAELQTPPNPHTAPQAEKVDFDMANVSLGVSTVGEFVLPAVMPVAAALLVVSNIDTVRAAGGQLSVGKIGLPLLYTGIAGMTLVSGQFFAAAIMLLCFRSWEQRYRRDVEVENQALLDESVGVPGDALAICADGLERIVPRSEIGVGQHLRVRAGDRIPADATVIDGAALVDEVRLLGDPAPATRIKGDEVLAGSRLLAGQLDLVALRTGLHTRAAQVSRALIATTVPAPAEWALNSHAEKFADRTVGPSLFAAGLGLLAGGPGMSLAAMRPDYSTAIGVAAPLETLRSVRIALRHGALIRSGEALSRLASSSWVILDDHEALQRADCELAEMQVRGVEEDRLLPALAAAGVWLGDPRGPALVRACRARRLIARRATLREIGATFVAIEYGGHVLRLSGKADRKRLAPLRVELDGVEVARLRFQRTSSLAAAASVRQLQRAGLRVLLASERESSAVAPLARRLGVDQFVSDADADSRRRLLRALSERGLSVVHVHAGPGLRDSGDAHLSVALADAADETSWHDADMVLFGQSIAPLPALVRLARDSITRVASMRRMALAPNLACVAGAFAFGLPGLAVIVISNLGTSMVYNNARRALRLASLEDTSPPEAVWCTEDVVPIDDEAILEDDILAKGECA
jgi:cation transport ATPase